MPGAVDTVLGASAALFITVPQPLQGDMVILLPTLHVRTEVQRVRDVVQAVSLSRHDPGAPLYKPFIKRFPC